MTYDDLGRTARGAALTFAAALRAERKNGGSGYYSETAERWIEKGAIWNATDATAFERNAFGYTAKDVSKLRSTLRAKGVRASEDDVHGILEQCLVLIDDGADAPTSSAESKATQRANRPAGNCMVCSTQPARVKLLKGELVALQTCESCNAAAKERMRKRRAR